MDSIKFVDLCLAESGGRFNLFRKIFGTLLAAIFGIQSLFIFGFGFFESVPGLLCERLGVDGGVEYFECSREEACNLNQTYQINYDDPKTLTNWITSFDLVCVEPYKISLFGSLMFLGLLFGSIFISRQGDVYGRKPILTLTVVVSSVSLLGILLTNNLYLLFGSIFLFGIAAAPRYTMSYVYASEIVDSKHESTYCMLAMIIDSLAMIVFGIYYQFVQSMYPLLWFQLIAQSVMQIVAYVFIPESPKFLYEKGDMDKFFKSIEAIAKINRAHINVSELKQLQEQNVDSQPTYGINTEPDSSQKSEQIQKSDERPSESTTSHQLVSSVEEKSSLKQFLTNKTYFLNALALSISWGVGSYSFYFTEFYMKFVPVSNEYLLSIAIGISDVISASSFKLLVMVASVKRIIGISYLSMTVIAFAFAICLYSQLELTHGIKIMYAVFVFSLRLASGTGFMMSYFANNQYFPPLLRAGIFAITNIASRLSTILSPIVANTLSNPSITVALAGAVATAATCLLKDAHEVKLEIPSKMQKQIS